MSLVIIFNTLELQITSIATVEHVYSEKGDGIIQLELRTKDQENIRNF